MSLPSIYIRDSSADEFTKKKRRQQIISQELGQDFSALFGDGQGGAQSRPGNLPEKVGQTNCENWVGSVPIPVGVAGPVEYFWQGQQRESYLPLATTEGALVASVSRGCKSITQAGGAKVFVKKSGMSRAPVFECADTQTALDLEKYLKDHRSELKKVAESTSSHLKLLELKTWIRGRSLYARFVFDTDLAMGMNMVTIACQAIADQVVEKVDGVSLLSLSSNACADKKDNSINSILGRGYWAQAEVVLSKKVVKSVLKTTPQKLISLHQHKNLVGSNLAGSLSQNAQVANVLAAIFTATGQDLAHVVEGSKAFDSLEMAGEDLYVAVTLPNLNMGTVGGGTYLPAQTQAREMMGIKASSSHAAAHLVAATAVASLAGEISLLASLAEHTLACSHQSLARE